MRNKFETEQNDDFDKHLWEVVGAIGLIYGIILGAAVVISEMSEENRDRENNFRDPTKSIVLTENKTGVNLRADLVEKQGSIVVFVPQSI